jgi:hypothetical protein
MKTSIWKYHTSLIRIFNLLVILLLIQDSNAQFINNIFKYSTLYASGSIDQPLQESTKEWYVTQDSRIQDITEIYPFDYIVSIGIRKMARFGYENKPNAFYDGTEENVGWKTNVGNADGFEYSFSRDWVRKQGDEYKNQSYFIRYLGKYWVGHLKFLEEGVVDLKYTQADLRGRASIGSYINITAGAVVRTHGPYGYNPIAIYLNDNSWWTLAYDHDYKDQAYTIIDYSNATPDTTVDWSWKNPEGEKIADTDGEFRKYYYGDIVNEFNAEKMAEVGIMMTLSAAIGFDFYKYSEDIWCHVWVNILPYHKHIYGDTNFSYGLFISRDLEGNGKDQWVDYNFGVNLGAKITKKIGLFVEGDYLKYWDKRIYSAKVGINYLIL